MNAKEFNITKLRGQENYHTWKFAMCNYLELNDLQNCIVAEDDKVKEKKPEKLSSAKTRLALSVEEQLYVHIEKCSSALEIWTTLQDLFEDKGWSRKIGLLRNLIGTRLEECQNMQVYIEKITGTANKLSGIGFNISDEWLGAILLAGLTENFKPLIMSLEGSVTVINADAIKMKLLDMQNSSNVGSGEAFFSNKHNKKAFKKSSKSKGTRKCYECGKLGHVSNDCWLKKKKSDSKNGEVSQKSFICTSAMMTSNKNKSEWCLDSGASNHMTPYRDLLTNVNKTAQHEITTANGATLIGNDYGNTILSLNGNEVDVKNVLHVPGLAMNLLSIGSIAEKGNKVLFVDDRCNIYDRENEMITTCKRESGIYRIQQNVDMCLSSRKMRESVKTWHKKLGHLNFTSMCKMRDGGVTGMNFFGTELEIKNCETCAMGKQSRLPFKPSNSKSTGILDIIHSDLMGPMETLSIGKTKYVASFVDDFSRKVFCYFLKSKDELCDIFEEFINFVQTQTERKIKILRTDNGGEYMTKRLQKLLKSNGTKHQLTTPYTPQQNGVAERMNRTIVEKARCLLYDANLPKCYWAEAVNMSIYLINRSVNSQCSTKTPEEIWSGVKVDIANLKQFGSDVMVHIPSQKRKKWDYKSQKLIFVGYDSESKGFRCIDTKTKKLTVSRDVIFNEKLELSEIEKQSTEKQIVEELKIEEISDENEDENFTDAAEVREKESFSIEISSDDDTVNNTIQSESSSLEGDDSKDEDFVPEEFEEESQPSIPIIKTRSKSFWPNFSSNLTCSKCYISQALNEPTNLLEISSRPDAQNWYSAIEAELNSLNENETWELVDLPAGQKIIKTKWVFKIKRDTNGDISRYKARLVAKGYTQRAGIDYDDIYSPVVRYSSIRFLVALAVKHGLKIHQMDAITAFLQGDIDEDIFIEQPEGFSDGTKRVCKLKRAIYGLKQASRQWNLKLDGALKSFGLTKSKMDPCIYFKEDLSLILAIYVDDIMIFWKNAVVLDKLKSSLCATFKMKDIGVAKSCVGIRITQTENGIELDQHMYVQDILKRFGMQDCKPIGTPSDMSQKLSKEMDQETSVEVPYQQAVGSLLYLAQCTRPDIAFAVNDVSRFNSNHGKIHWNAVKRIFRYIKGTADFKLTYEKSQNFEIVGFCDADWASDIDNRRSCTGYVFKLSNAAISWGSKRQNTVALSSTKAEYMAMSSAIQEAIWLRQLAKELDQNLNKPVNLLCDNQSTIKLAESDAYRPRTKHIDIRFHFIREKVLDKKISINFVNSEGNVADSLTKPVTKEKFVFCTEHMGLRHIQQNIKN